MTTVQKRARQREEMVIFLMPLRPWYYCLTCRRDSKLALPRLLTTRTLKRRPRSETTNKQDSNNNNDLARFIAANGPARLPLVWPVFGLLGSLFWAFPHSISELRQLTSGAVDDE